MDRKNVIGILVVLCFTGLSLAACVSAQLQVSYETTTPVSALTSTPQGKIGEMVRGGDVSITVIQVERMTQVGTARLPQPGTVFVAIELIVESQARAGVYINPLFARLQDDASNVHNISFVGKDPFLETRVNLPKGEKVQGWVTFEVPESAKGLILIYQAVGSNPDAGVRIDLGM
ncbi:DUF4352 domain-containing protein [Candidatus Amarolinea dominans]|uniref:DUF4352 domain-containing protein n=1 Tax=Candidatus Amarolinea dominans TaxID=3140696 RepID=UPI003135DE27|nr:DUF4352 domain-containing protein [Anaerolineae bacterium]